MSKLKTALLSGLGIVGGVVTLKTLRKRRTETVDDADAESLDDEAAVDDTDAESLDDEAAVDDADAESLDGRESRGLRSADGVASKKNARRIRYAG